VRRPGGLRRGLLAGDRHVRSAAAHGPDGYLGGQPADDLDEFDDLDHLHDEQLGRRVVLVGRIGRRRGIVADHLWRNREREHGRGHRRGYGRRWNEYERRGFAQRRHVRYRLIGIRQRRQRRQRPALTPAVAACPKSRSGWGPTPLRAQPPSTQTHFFVVFVVVVVVVLVGTGFETSVALYSTRVPG